MSNDLVTNVDAFKKGPAAIFKAQPITDSLADGIGQSYGVIGYKGKTWSLRYRGERKVVVRPDDGTPAAHLDVIIALAASVKSKSFYPEYNPDEEAKPPLCSSINGLTPDDGVTQKQVADGGTCALCPRNVWKQQANGKKGRECTDYKRLAVILMPNVSKMLIGEALMEPVFLRIPPASLNNLARLGEQMDAMGYPYSSYITRITFDPQEAHPKMIFTALQPLGDAEAQVVVTIRQDPMAGRIVNGDVALPALAGPVTAPVTPPAQANPQQPAMLNLQVTSTLDTTATASSDKGFSVLQTSSPPNTVAQPATQSPPVSGTLPSTAPETIDTGFGGVSTAGKGTNGFSSPLNGETEVIPAPFSDTGEPTLSDDALDARIASLLPPK